MQTYTVLIGDTLYGISKQFGVSVDSIKNTNSLEDSIIIPGQVLMIPTISTTILYTVVRGDTLYSLAKTYNTSVDEIIRINNLKTTSLNIGDQLILPLLSDNSYTIYTVKKGDSLYSIAKAYNTTVDDIMSTNNLTNTNLSINQQLKIKKKSDEDTTTYSTYVVKKGDSLYSISKAYNMSVDELKQINNLTSNTLSIGQVLKVIPKEEEYEITNEACYGEDYTTPTYQTYTVKKGDSLYQIAKKYNVSVDSIKELNDLKNNNLSIGQILKIKEVK